MKICPTRPIDPPSNSPLKLRLWFSVWTLVVLYGLGSSLAQSPADQPQNEIAQKLAKLGVVGFDDAATRTGKSLVAELNEVPLIDTQLILEQMKQATPTGKNWLLGLANTHHQRLKQHSPNQREAELKRLSLFVQRLDEDPESRYTAFDWLTRDDAPLRQELLASMTEDPSPELRYAAIAQALPGAKTRHELRTLLDSARDYEQVTLILARLGDLGDRIDTTSHFGFLTNWKLLGPFDNRLPNQFDLIYPVEMDAIYEPDRLKDTYPGKHGEVAWKSIQTNEPDGKVDLAKLFPDEKGAIIYAVGEFSSDQTTQAEIRFSSITAHKVWCNGQLLISNEVYHAAAQVDRLFDQFTAPVQLNQGVNRLLVKACQNEQSEDWAQQFYFHLRVTDPTGKPLRTSEQDTSPETPNYDE